MGEKIVLIDGHSILNRAFFALPDLTNDEGEHTGAVYGFLNILFKIIEEEEPDYLAVAFDVHAPTFRHKRYEAYKGTRKPMAQELRSQVPLIKEVLSAMGVTRVELSGYEADDVLGTLSRRAEGEGLEVSVISGDRDLLQLATDKVRIRIPKTKKTGNVIENYYASDVVKLYGVTPSEFIDLKALMGDTADNIPGVPSIGEKTGMKIIAEYKSIENAREHAEEIKPKKASENLVEFYDQALLSKELATIVVDAPVEFDMEGARLGTLYTPEAYAIFKRLGFKNFLGRFEGTRRVFDLGERLVFPEGDAQGFKADALGYAARGGAVAADVVSAEDGELLGIVISAGDVAFLDLSDNPMFKNMYIDAVGEILSAADRIITGSAKELVKLFPGLSGKEIFDVCIAEYVINPLAGDFEASYLAEKYLDVDVRERSEHIGNSKYAAAYKKDRRNFAVYLCEKTCIRAMAADEIRKSLDENGFEIYRDIEMPLAYALAGMEKEGILADRDELLRCGEDFAGRIDGLKTKIYELAGEEFNINSTRELGRVLFEKLGLKNGKKTKSGYSTAADVLEKLAPESEIVRDILDYRRLSKLKSTYADALMEYIAEDGRIHTTFCQTVTATGRLSSVNPNLQNIPVRSEEGRLLRKVFVAKPGYRLVDADYSQIELRVLAHLSGDEKLVEAYRSDADIHRITAAHVFKISPEEVTDAQRSAAKAVNFGIVYGISSYGLMENLHISRKEASGYIESYFEAYPRLKEYLEGLVETAKSEGYAVTMYGRRRPIPELKSSNFMTRSFGERIAKNSPIQGSAADIIKLAMIAVDGRIRREGLKCRLILQVHDELLIEAPEDEVETVKALLKEEMENVADLMVPLIANVSVGESWYEAK